MTARLHCETSNVSTHITHGRHSSPHNGHGNSRQHSSSSHDDTIDSSHRSRHSREGRSSSAHNSNDHHHGHSREQSSHHHPEHSSHSRDHSSRHRGHCSHSRDHSSHHHSHSRESSSSSHHNNHRTKGLEKLHHYLNETLNLPHGLQSTVEQVYNSLDSRIFLVENSKGMCGGDSHVMKWENDGGSVGKVDGASRWDELSQVSCLGDVPI